MTLGLNSPPAAVSLWSCLTPPASRLPAGTRGYLEILPAGLGKQGLNVGQWCRWPPTHQLHGTSH